MNLNHLRNRPLPVLLAGAAAVAVIGLGVTSLDPGSSAGAGERPPVTAPEPLDGPFVGGPASDPGPVDDPFVGGPASDPGPIDGGPLSDGRHFGAVAGAYVGPPELAFDDMELLPGDGDGEVTIRNVGERTVSVPVAEDVVVTRVDCSGASCVEGASISYDDFTRSWNTDSRYWVTVEGGVVVRIDEQYLP